MHARRLRARRVTRQRSAARTRAPVARRDVRGVDGALTRRSDTEHRARRAVCRSTRERSGLDVSEYPAVERSLARRTRARGAAPYIAWKRGPASVNAVLRAAVAGACGLQCAVTRLMTTVTTPRTRPWSARAWSGSPGACFQPARVPGSAYVADNSSSEGSGERHPAAGRSGSLVTMSR
jgi:hypothetical protein